jgi:hypothetical protein
VLIFFLFLKRSKIDISEKMKCLRHLLLEEGRIVFAGAIRWRASNRKITPVRSC